MADKTDAVGGSPSGAFSPLGQKLFAVLWIATILGNVGSFMRDVASAWLVTDLSPSPLAVSAIQAAATLPAFLLAIPAGVLSDIVDRRHLLIGILLGLASVSMLLSALSATGAVTVEALVALTFIGGIGAALSAPSWQAIVPELVQRSDLKSAVALNSLGFNVARAIGPAVGGLLVAAIGAAATYLFDIASDLIVIAVLLWWKREATVDDGLREHFGGALRAGLRYARANAHLRAVLKRAFLFFLLVSAIWALLPIVARRELGGGPGLYGLLLGFVGAGAAASAMVMPALRTWLGQDDVVLGAVVLTVAVFVTVATVSVTWIVALSTLFLGVAWIAVLTTLNGTVQAILPNWVRGRALALYITVQSGAMALGSLVWGALAERIGTMGALLVAAGCLALLALWWQTLGAKLPTGEDDLSPAESWARPSLAEPVGHDRGPVIVTVAYQVTASDKPAFLKALHDFSPQRRRDGAYAWGVSEDAENPERLVEWFFVESWAEHLRQHRRISKSDADVQTGLLCYHAGSTPPVVTHLISLDEPKTRS
jgi:MFS family permease